MSYVLHRNVGIGDEHIPHDFEHADQTTRKATAFAATDINHITKQLSDDSFWRVTAAGSPGTTVPFIPPPPAIGNIGEALVVESDGAGGVKWGFASGIGGLNSDDTYDNFAGNPADIVIDGAEGQGDLSFKPATTYGVVFSLVNNNAAVTGFEIVNGTDNFKATRGAANELSFDFNCVDFDLAASGTVTISGITSTDVVNLASGGDSSNRVLSSLSMGRDTVGGDGWIQVMGAAAGEVLQLNPEGGNVGVGVAAPGGKLDVAGVSIVTDGSDSSNYVFDSLSMGHDTVTDASWVQSAGVAAGSVLELNPNGGQISLGDDLMTDFYLASDTNTFLGVGVAGAGNLAHAAGTEGWNNTSSGYQSLYSNTTGSYNTSSGRSALYSNTTGSYNTSSGYESLYGNTTGSYNTSIGRSALYSNTTGTYNAAIGRSALSSNTEGWYNIGIGYQAGDNITTAYYCIMIGYDIDADSATANYQLNIGDTIKGNLSTGYVYIPSGSDSSNYVFDSLSMGHDTVTDTSWIQSAGAAAGSLLELNPNGGNISVGGIVLGNEGTNIASAGNMAAPDANYCTVTGTTTINTMAATGITAGTIITLKFSGALTLKHATAGTGAQFYMQRTTLDLPVLAGDIYTFIYDGTNWVGEQC